VFKEAVKWVLAFVVEVVKSSFHAISDTIKGVTKIFQEIIDFFRNVFS
jgi:phage-related protein